MSLYKKIGPMRLPCALSNGKSADFKLFMYKFEHGFYYVIQMGQVQGVDNPLVRVHSMCSFAHLFNSLRCDCKAQLDKAMLEIDKEGCGLIVYAWPHEGRGIGNWDHVRVYMEQDKGEDTVTSYEVLGLPVDARDYADAVKVILEYDLKAVRLLTNNPRKVKSFEEAGIGVERIPLICNVHKLSESQISVKRDKLGHLFDL